MKDLFLQTGYRIAAAVRWLRGFFRHVFYGLKIKSFGHLSLYRILKIYSAGLINGAIAARAESVAYSFFMALFPAVVFVFSVIPYIPIAGLQETLMQTIEEAMQVTNKAVMEALDGLPPVKVHCSLLAEEAIHAALWDYAEKNHITIEGLQKPKNDISEGEEEEDY